MSIHELRILPKYFKAVIEGAKTFEIRKNDKDFKIGDTLILKEYENYSFYSSEFGKDGYFTGKEITKEISYMLEGGQYGLEEEFFILGFKQEGIILKNINLTGITVLEQINKVKEEETEFMVAIELADEENAIEEFFDNNQVKLGLIEKVFGIKANEVMKKYPKHLEKIKNRPRN